MSPVPTASARPSARCCPRSSSSTVCGTKIDALNAAVLDELRAAGRSLPSSTRIGGRFAIRACYINPRNDREHVDFLVQDVLESGRRLSAE